MTDAITRICPDCRVQLDGAPGDERHACPAAPRPGPGLLGAVIDDRYEVRAHLGEGGMGVVYKARHVLLNKPVALKVLRQAHSDAARHRFVREAQAAAAIRHSSIVDITDFGVLPDGRTYLVMEYLQGQTLAAALSDGFLDLRRGLHIAVQIARGLGAVHDCGVVHRDLKPDNIFLVEREGERDLVKIVDFGIAKLREAQRLTDEGMVVGTAEYMSPEQATGQDVDARSDQYSLGCILYEVATGELPFPGKTIAAIMHRHVYEEVEPPRRRAPGRGIPQSLEALILRTLHKDPARRYPSMLALALALQHELDALEGTGAPATRAAPWTEAVPRWWRRPAVLGPAVATVLGALIGLVAVPRLLAPRPPSPPGSATGASGGAAAPGSIAAGPASGAVAAGPAPAQTAGAAGPAPSPGAAAPDGAPAAAPIAAPPRAAPAERAAPAAPLRLTLVITQPVDTPVSVSCGGRPRPCQGSCAVVVEPGARCEVRAPGFQPRLLRHGELSRQARDGRLNQRVALTPVRL